MIKAEAEATFPGDWREPGDEAWVVKAVNGEGTRVPFLGVLYAYKDEEGKTRMLARPGFDIDALSDGLYVLVESHARLGPDARIVEIRPRLHIREIRDQAFKPYWVDYGMVPVVVSPMTPAPVPPKPAPQGTPIPHGNR